nr:Fe(3+)-hydroxamate ABC transporter permease FhuB [Phyllobacterium leguminum]
MLPLFISIGAAALLGHAAISLLPMASWPAFPFDPDRMTTQQIILAYGLFPRAAVAVLAGAALGLAGALLQQLLHNPIADPSTLGVSSGAQLAIVAATLFFPSVLDGHRELVALGGAAIAAGIVFSIGWRRSFDPVSMVVSGLLVGITASALSAALTLSQGEYLMSLVTWNGGALSQQDWSVAQRLAVELVIGGAIALLLARPLHLLSLGDTGARSLGISLTWLRLAVSSLAVCLAAGVAASVGLVSFIGLAAPTLVRSCGLRRPVAVLLASAAAGGILLWFCDGVVQLLAATTSETFPTGAITGLLGAPLLLWLLPRISIVAVPQNGAVSINRRRRSALVLPLILLLAVASIGLLIGKMAHGWQILPATEVRDLLPLRWPRLLAAAAAGSLLAMAGTLLQRLTANPMASPEVIGVSGGAGIGFAAAITIFPAAGMAALFTGAGLGAILVMGVVLLYASQRHLAPERLLLAGIAVSSFTSAVLSALLAVGDQRSWQILAWLGGSASAATPGSALILAMLALFVLAISLLLARWLSVLPLGQAVPPALGVPLRPARLAIILVAGLATGAASMLVGPLSFVGLMGPHIALKAGFARAQDQVLAACLIGALLMTLADLGARTLTFPYELPLGLFAALAGAPYLAWLIGWRK